MNHDREHASFIAWAAEGHKDSMGLPFSDWLVARLDDDGRAIRGADLLVVYETQAQLLARNRLPATGPNDPQQRSLFS